MKRTIWRRRSVDSDGSLNGDRRFDFRQSPAPGAEANLATTLRSFHEPSPNVRSATLSHPSARVLYGLLSRPQARRISKIGIYSPPSLMRPHDPPPPPQHLLHPALRYSIHIRNTFVPHFWSFLALHSFRLFRLLSSATLLSRFTLSSGLMPCTSPHALHL